MSFAWPVSLTPQTVAWGLQKTGAQFRSPMAGSVEAISYVGDYWRCSLTLPQRKMRVGSEGEAFFSRVAGGVETVLVPYWVRLVPAGTMRGSPVLAAGAVYGALSLSITTTGTLKAGDMIGVGTQLFQVFQDCAPVSGTLTVPLVNHVRVALTSGAAVTWNAPTVTMLVPSMVAMASYRPGSQDGIVVDLEEA